VQKPEEAVAKPIIPTFRPRARDELCLLQVLEKPMRSPNRQVAIFGDLGNASSICRSSNALKRIEIAFQRRIGFARQFLAFQCKSRLKGVLDSAGK
jgi:hypothetical protein